MSCDTAVRGLWLHCRQNSRVVIDYPDTRSPTTYIVAPNSEYVFGQMSMYMYLIFKELYTKLTSVSRVSYLARCLNFRINTDYLSLFGVFLNLSNTRLFSSILCFKISENLRVMKFTIFVIFFKTDVLFRI